ncbi:hypothetical protein HD554DRAFT_2068527 [Boletus coccyginus]|nr:hypothetical protein HD554DRAFT_2068527 [Boletus coccyginus]
MTLPRRPGTMTGRGRGPSQNKTDWMRFVILAPRTMNQGIGMGCSGSVASNVQHCERSAERRWREREKAEAESKKDNGKTKEKDSKSKRMTTKNPSLVTGLLGTSSSGPSGDHDVKKAAQLKTASSPAQALTQFIARKESWQPRMRNARQRKPENDGRKLKLVSRSKTTKDILRKRSNGKGRRKHAVKRNGRKGRSKSSHQWLQTKEAS